MGKYVGIWIDQRKAYIVSVNKNTVDAEKKIEESITHIESDVEKHIRLSGGSRAGKTPYGPQDIAVDSKIDDRRKRQLQKYYQNIIRIIRDARKILIFGPGKAKQQLEKEIKKSIELAQKVLPLETTDKMTEKQIAAKIRKYFASYT